jgi:hypothetical protein
MVKLVSTESTFWIWPSSVCTTISSRYHLQRFIQGGGLHKLLKFNQHHEPFFRKLICYFLGPICRDPIFFYLKCSYLLGRHMTDKLLNAKYEQTHPTIQCYWGTHLYIHTDKDMIFQKPLSHIQECWRCVHCQNLKSDFFTIKILPCIY